MDEISKIGDINSVNDLFDFKLSIKTIFFLAFAWAAVCMIFVVFMMGGVNNTVNYVITIIETIKSTVIETRNRKINKQHEKPPSNNSNETNTDKNSKD
jgi:hypothetical protein